MNIDRLIEDVFANNRVKRWLKIYLEGVRAQEKGRLSRAIKLFSRACARARELKLKTELVISLLSLADVRYLGQDMAGVERSLSMAVEKSDLLDGEKRVLHAVSLSKLGNFCLETGQFSEGREYLEKADNVFRSGLAEFCPDSLINSLLLTACFLGEKSWRRALAQVEYSKKLASKFVGPKDIAVMLLNEQGFEAAKNLGQKELSHKYKEALDKIANLKIFEISDQLDFLFLNVIELCEHVREREEEDVVDCSPDQDKDKEQEQTSSMEKINETFPGLVNEPARKSL